MQRYYDLKIKIPVFIILLLCFTVFCTAAITLYVFTANVGIFGDLQRTAKITAAATILALIAVLLVGFSVAREIRTPLLTMLRGVRDQQAGGRDINNIVVNQGDEFNVLIDFCNRLSLALKGKMDELKSSYQEVERMRNYLMNILSSAPSAIIVADSLKVITLCNRALEEITGFKQDEITGMTLRDFLLSIKISFIPDMRNPVNKAGVLYLEREARITRKDGIIIPIAVVTAAILHNETETTGGNIFFIRDLTLVKQLEEDLAHDDRLKIMGEMSASIIHEIGNPLAGMGNLLEALEDELNEQGVSSGLIAILQEEVGRLNNLVLNLLDFTNKTATEKEQVNMEQLAESVIRLLGSEITEKRIKIKREYPGNPPLLHVEQQKLKQVMINIIKNAIQAVGNGGIISVKIDFVKSPGTVIQGSGTYLAITIKDNGVGIPRDSISRVFEPFYTDKTKGTGLGLTISQKIVREHGGYIDVYSVPHEFTEFRVYLPVDSEQEMKGWE